MQKTVPTNGAESPAEGRDKREWITVRLARVFFSRSLIHEQIKCYTGCGATQTSGMLPVTSY